MVALHILWVVEIKGNGNAKWAHDIIYDGYVKYILLLVLSLFPHSNSILTFVLSCLFSQ